MADAQLHLRKLVVTPQGGQPFLVIEVEVTLPRLGTVEYQIPGAVVAALAARLTAVAQEHPELCGSVGRVVDRVDWEGRVDPEKVGEN